MRRRFSRTAARRIDKAWHALMLAADADYIDFRKENAVAVMAAVDQLPKKLRKQVDDLGPAAHEANERIEKLLGIEA